MPQISLGRAIGHAPDRPELSEEYRAYLRSPAWRELRRLVLIRDDHKCRQCGATERLEVHHLTYKRLGHEPMSDLIALCEPCHEAADRRRVERQHARRFGVNIEKWW